ncbi:MAG: M18 family aminopeptidase [Deltaproteobacteria bacterium]|nr:M18 family aminopeptidase [Deltaproteobacteria bacterium]
MPESVPPATHDLLAFVEDSPTPWHAVAEAQSRLDAKGYVQVHEADAEWNLAPGTKAYVIRDGGSIVAWTMGRKAAVDAGFRIIGAHTDSPNLRLKTRPSVTKEGYAQLGLQTYGGVLLHTWFDRDLSLAGRVTVRTGSNPLTLETRLLRIDRPLCRIPNLAIHLNRSVRTDGFKPNQQSHLPAVWGMASDDLSVEGFLADELGVATEEVLAWDMCLYDVQPPAVSGVDNAFIHCPRLDNLGSTHAALLALLDADQADTTGVVTLFDHEEIGSRTSRGAAGSLTKDVLRRLAGGTMELARATGRSMMVSADMAHGVHPNYADKHEPEHKPMLNGGPVIKAHADWKYATEAESAAAFRGLCEDHGVPVQDFVTRSDLACGSTIGPIVSSALGIRTVDVGNAMWSMHSIREMAGSEDQPHMVAAMTAFLGWDQSF